MVMGVFEKYFINSKVISYCSSNIFCMGFFLLKVHKVIYLFCRIPEDNPFNMGGSQSAEKTQSATSANTLQTQSSAQNYPSECPMHKSEAPPQSFPSECPMHQKSTPSPSSGCPMHEGGANEEEIDPRNMVQYNCSLFLCTCIRFQVLYFLTNVLRFLY